MALPLPHVYSGKVRDIYGVGDDQLALLQRELCQAVFHPGCHRRRWLGSVTVDGLSQRVAGEIEMADFGQQNAVQVLPTGEVRRVTITYSAGHASLDLTR